MRDITKTIAEIGESECIYDQLSILTQLVDKYNTEGHVLIRLEFENSHSISFYISNLHNGFTSHGKYTYSNMGAKMAWVGLEYYYNQIINNL
ncbi:hypothetical protein Q2490_16825 [Myroides odoratimimus]|uniref:hypothetical protein n=1 Tax=Myroides odoratimimus TaxID=76832 RepID=UPI0026DEEC1F|nr:hypothetical protein [Myroides odoratimimus]MDO5858942.1 hypothetical protein [Myroides odoratimimus]